MCDERKYGTWLGNMLQFQGFTINNHKSENELKKMKEPVTIISFNTWVWVDINLTTCL